MLAARGIAYVPDYLANAGGVIDFHQEVHRRQPGGGAAARSSGSATSPRSVLARAAATGETPLPGGRPDRARPHPRRTRLRGTTWPPAARSWSGCSRRYGVDTVFGIPGVHTVELYRGLPATRIRHVTPRHEQGAGFMADGYARVSGKPGVCFIITGPGMTNILTAMGQAYGDSVPMLVISSVNRTEQLAMGQGRLHELPLAAGGGGRASRRSATPSCTRASCPRCWRAPSRCSRSARPRPVHIEIPIDVITAPADDLPLAAAPPARAARARPRRDRPRGRRCWPAPSTPLLVLGGGAVRGGRGGRGRWPSGWTLPVINTVNAKGMLPPGHPLHAGENMAWPPLREALRAADVVLAVGTEFGETEMYPGPRPLRFDGKLIRIDIDPEQLVRGFPCRSSRSSSDSRQALRALLDALPASAPCAPAT